MKKLFLPAAVLFFQAVSAQYYYGDISGTRETNELIKQYNLNKVRTVAVYGVDANEVKADNYSEFYEVKDNGLTLKKTVIREFNRNVTYYKFDSRGLLLSINDSASGMNRRTIYEYDAAGRISMIRETQEDNASDFSQSEEHSWSYLANGQPAKMWRTINGSDSLEVQFTYDENGNPGEEIAYKKGIETNRIYYYYDARNRITDIVRYNKKVKKLMPDVILTYDEDNRVIQKMTSAPPDNFGRVVWVGFFIWRYIYNGQGLKTREALFDNDQKLTGKIIYNYTFGR